MTDSDHWRFLCEIQFMCDYYYTRKPIIYYWHIDIFFNSDYKCDRVHNKYLVHAIAQESLFCMIFATKLRTSFFELLSFVLVYHMDETSM